MKIIFWGIGVRLNVVLQMIRTLSEEVEIVGFTDNDSSKWGGDCYPPSEILKKEFDKIIIMSDEFYDEIKRDIM